MIQREMNLLGSFDFVIAWKFEHGNPTPPYPLNAGTSMNTCIGLQPAPGMNIVRSCCTVLYHQPLRGGRFDGYICTTTSLSCENTKKYIK
jgi:hypothetical protein